VALTPLKRAFLALEKAEARLAAVEGAQREPIAVIGAGCRVPGGADDLASFWALMRDRRDEIAPVPADRFDIDAYYDADPEVPGRIATRQGGFLRDVDLFDAPFFGIAPREAQGMDPQQRLLLEVAWEALENAGQAPDRLSGSATGVYVGVTASDYTYLQLKTGDQALLDAHFTSGIAHSVVSGRVSYLLGLQGPSVTIDTACSSSLVAVHLACQALRAKDCRMALAGGVNLILSPDLYIALSRSRMLAPDGRCKTFDAAADGFARGEGCGVIVLKRLADARADGDRILALIRGSALNQDGPSSGLTAPNGPAQEAVIRDAIAHAGLRPGDISYVEAHGTGTQLGDPLEMQALGAVFREGRDDRRPVLVGSVKTNIGHLEAAAGVIGLLKVVVSLVHRRIPAHLHFHRPSPHIPWDELPLVVPTALIPWEPLDGRRCAGVSSFGFSGTNAHVVLEEAPAEDAATASRHADGAVPRLFALSARDETALRELASRHAAQLPTDRALADICFTANAGRAHFAHRATVIAHSTTALRDALAAGVTSAHVTRRDPPRIAFLFTGQGAQYPGMARGLYEAAPVFRAALDRCATHLEPWLDRQLLDVLFDGGDAIHDTTYTQPALFAVEHALVELLRSWGISPTAVMGHSVGEYVAACVAGVFSLEDALRLIAARGRLMGSLPAGGAMAAVFAPEERAERAIAAHRERVSLAAVNGPEQTVISGAALDIEAICRALAADGVRCKPLTVSHAFHSPLVDPILDAFEREAAAVPLAGPQLRLISNVSGRVADAHELTQAAYWRRHLRQAVRFCDGLGALAALKPDCIVEIGPHPTLLSFASAVLGDGGPQLIRTLQMGGRDAEQALEALGALYRAGAEIDWRGAMGGEPARVVELPTYPFQRQRCWFKAAPAPAAGPSGRATGHPILGTRLRSASSEAIFEGRLTADQPAFLRHHRVQGLVVTPATAYLETLCAAARACLGAEHVAVADVAVDEAMLLEDDGAGRTVQVVAAPAPGGALRAALSSLAEGATDDEPWTRHVAATLELGPAAPAEAPSLDDARARCPDALAAEAHYASFERRGLAFGDAFRVVRRMWRGSGEAVGEVELGAELAAEAAHYQLHPVLLDGCLQVLAAALDGGDDALFLPIGIGRYTPYRGGATRCWSHVAVRAGSGDGETRHADVRIFAAGGLIAELCDVQLKRAARDALARLGERWLDDALYELRWRPAASAEPVPLAELRAAASAELPALRRTAAIETYDAFLPRFEARCARDVARAMRKLGWAGGTPADPEALGVAPQHRRLFARLQEILRHAGAEADADAPAELGAIPPGAEAEVELTDRVAGQLAEALRGERDPMELLFPGGSLALPERMYRDAPTAVVFNGLIAEVMGALAARASGRSLRILELGGGTGGTTVRVLPRLPRQGVEYVFTDVGPSFVARAKERFGSYRFARFEVLDLERDPSEQGFAAESFDVVLASNVIHATADLRRTLAFVRRLLAPGGMLAMLEVTAPQRWFDLTVGLTEGWWAFTDTELRPDYPTLSRQRWLALLEECGFGAAAALPEGSPKGALGLQSLFLGRSERPARTWHIVGQGEVATALAERLTARGDRCATSAGELPGGAPHGVVYARALDDDGDAALRGAVAVARALAGSSPPPRLVVLTRGAHSIDGKEPALSPLAATLWGLRRTIELEHPELRAVAIDLDPAGDAAEVDALLRELDSPGAEPEVALRGGERCVARLCRVPRASRTRSAALVELAAEPRGSLDALALRPFTPREPGPGEVAIAVEATGLNFKDVLNALGMYPGDPGPLGGECAGRVVAVGAGVRSVAVGDNVIAVAGGSFASRVVARAELVQRRPREMTADEGAAFPIAFLTAEYCLAELAKVRAGDRVLIHAAAGGVGMAAVRLALRTGAEVFATAGAPWKRELVRRLGATHVLDSRSPVFAEEILAHTGQRGVDVVLNSLSGELIDASFRALARGGRFIEIGKRGIKEPAWVAALDRDIDYHIVDWGETAARDPELIGGLFARLVGELESGALVSLPRHVFVLDAADRAFRFMAKARHAGKIVVRHGPPAPVPIRRDGTYLVSGGLSGLGLEVAQWLAERGAGRLALLGRRGVPAQAAARLAALRERGTAVVAEALDVTDEAALTALLERLRHDGPPLRGVIHSAGVLDNAGILQLDDDRLARVLAPKVRGGALLDALTDGDPLDFFAIFSSIASLLGAAGQANHAAANAFLDALARERQSRGRPGLSINWGAWSEIGAAAELGIADRLADKGLAALTPRQGILAFERLLGGERAQVAVLPIDWRRYLGDRSAPPLLSELALGDAPAVATTKPAAGRPLGLQERLDGMPPGRWRKEVAAFVRETALAALGIDPGAAVDARAPLGELGLDSLLAVELRNKLGAGLGKPLPVTLLFDFPTIDALTDHLLEQLGGATADHGAPPEPQPGAPAASDLVDAVEDLSDEEVERLLAARKRATP
jgi:acyl transferase domain-containing protein/NADPH:quinone reductase-like Zn-dependent oxidoreductase/acyl carrier protein